MTKTINNRINIYKLFLYLLIYKITIDVIYIVSISPIYDYTGLTLNINYFSLIITFFYFCFIVALFPRDKSRPSTYLYLIMILFLVIPTLSYCWLNNQSLLYTTFITICTLIIALFLKVKVVYIVEEFKSARRLFNILFLFYVVITIYMIIKRGGVDLRALNLDLIYELRSEASFSGILGYLLNWCAKVFCPFFFAYFIYKKNYLNIVIVLTLQLLLYLSFGFKAYLFSIGMLIMVVLAMRKQKFERDFTIGFTVLVIVSYLFYLFRLTNDLLNSIPYRMIFVPAQIQYQYYDFFINREKMLFADGFIGKIFSIKSPFDQSVPFVIAKYYHDAESHSNTGLFSDAYSNGGFIAMILLAIIFAIVLYMIDSLTKKIPSYLVVASFSYMMFVINDNSLLTTLLTGGMGLMIILLFLFNSSIIKNNSSAP